MSYDYDDERFDDFLFSIAETMGGAEGIFNVVNSFLKRRTDFFVFNTPENGIGFEPGRCE